MTSKWTGADMDELEEMIELADEEDAPELTEDEKFATGVLSEVGMDRIRVLDYKALKFIQDN
jgi:hypothetical protein